MLRDQAVMEEFARQCRAPNLAACDRGKTPVSARFFQLFPEWDEGLSDARNPFAGIVMGLAGRDGRPAF